jgi:hypothetical protein
MLAGALVTAWIDSSAAPPAPDQSGRASTSSRATNIPSIPKAERLHQRAAEPPLPRRGRNPFVYGSRTPARNESPAGRAAETAAAAAPAVEAPALPVFRLSGIASDAKEGATVFTAILNDNGAMVFAKAGDKLSNGYSVVRVEEMSVTLVDATGVTQTIKLP